MNPEDNASPMDVPADFANGVKTVRGFVSNRYRVEPSSGTAAAPGTVASFTLPEGSILDLHSLTLAFDVLTTQQADATTTTVICTGKVYDANAFIQRFEVLCNGRQLCNVDDYATLSRIKSLIQSRDRFETISRPLAHTYVDNDTSTYNDVDNLTLIIPSFQSFLGETSMRFLPTSIVGSVTVRITFAPTATALVYKDVGDYTAALTTESAANASAVKYSVSNLRMHVDAVSCPGYQQFLQARIAADGYVAVYYKDYQLSASDTIVSANASVRWSQSVSSLDRVYAVLRKPDYLSANTIEAVSTSSSIMSDKLIAKAHNFTLARSNALKDDALYSWEVNSVQHPSYTATLGDALYDFGRLCNPTALGGTMVTARDEYASTCGVLPLILNLNDRVGLKSGYNTRGVSSQISLRLYNLASVSSTAPLLLSVFSESTAELRIGAGMTVVVDA